MFHGGEFLCILYVINNILYILPSKSYNLEIRLALYNDFEEFYLPLFIYYAINHWHFDPDEPIHGAPYDQELITEPLDANYINLLHDNANDYSDIKRLNTNKNKANLVRIPPSIEKIPLQEPPKDN